jgi:hypothetical protein
MARDERWVVVAGLAGGLLMGALWVVVAAIVVGSTDPQEQAAASDGTLALLGIGFGLVSAVLLAALPGRRPTLRAGVALTAATAGGLVAWGTGQALGVRPLRADGVVLLWPIVLGIVTSVRLLVVHFIGRE